MENKLEQLLNSLIEKGWKPFGDNAIKFDYDGMKTCCGYGAITYLYRDSYIDDYGDEVEYEEWRRQFNNRQLVSKESGLWQFVCDNCMQVGEFNNRSKNSGDLYTDIYYEYFVIESSLCDEDKLEEFLLNSIKLD